MGEEEAGDAGKDRSCDAAPEVQLDTFAAEAVVVGVHDTAQDRGPGAGGREDGKAANGRGGLLVAFEELKQRYDEQNGGRDVQGEDVEVTEDREEGRAARFSIGRKDERQCDQEEVSTDDPSDGLADGQSVEAFFDTVERGHGAKVGSMFMGSGCLGVKRKRPHEALLIRHKKSPRVAAGFL